MSQRDQFERQLSSALASLFFFFNQVGHVKSLPLMCIGLSAAHAIEPASPNIGRRVLPTPRRTKRVGDYSPAQSTARPWHLAPQHSQPIAFTVWPPGPSRKISVRGPNAIIVHHFPATIVAGVKCFWFVQRQGASHFRTEFNLVGVSGCPSCPNSVSSVAASGAIELAESASAAGFVADGGIEILPGCCVLLRRSAERIGRRKLATAQQEIQSPSSADPAR